MIGSRCDVRGMHLEDSFEVLSSCYESMIESRCDVRGMHLEDSFEVVGIYFCRVTGRVDCVDVAWYKMFCAVGGSARWRGIA